MPESTTVTPERSVPKPVFTDAEAGAKEFPSSRSRSYNYFEPRKRRASVYEDVTVDVQPDPERHLTQGWVYAFANGDSGYPQEWTELKSSNWHEFLDPNEEWEQTIYRNNSNTVRQICATLANAKAADAYAAWNSAWVKVVERHVSAWAHAEQGLGMHVYTPAQRDAPTNMINNALCVGAVHKLRFAQDIILYNLEVSEQIEGFDGAAHKEAWQNDPVWQGARENVEKLTGIRDWARGVLRDGRRVRAARRRAVPQRVRDAGRGAAGRLRHPGVMGCGEADTAREQRGARALFRMLADDPQHGAANKALMQSWLDEWIPVSLQAAQQMQPIWSQISEKVVRFDDSLERSKTRMADLLEDLTLDVPQGDPRMTEFHSDRTSSNQAGVTLMNNQVGYVVAQVMADKKDITIRELPVDDPRRRHQQDRLRLPGDRRRPRLGRLRPGRLRGDHVDALRPHGRARRPRPDVRQPRGRGRVHRLRPAAVGEG